MSKKWEMLEQEWEMPIVDILTTVVETTENQAQAAERLGVTQGTISLWLRLLGLAVVRKVISRYTLTELGKQAVSHE